MSYLNVDEVATATQNLATAHPALCSLIPLPHTTFEGRSCTALRLGAGAPGSRDCAIVLCGVHAREWGSCEIGLNFCTDLLEAYVGGTGLAYGGKSFTAAQVQMLLDTLHLVVLPLVNPDGRHHSQTSEAMWRRNRNPAQSGGNAACVGVDLNRNYDFLFNLSAFSPASAASIYTSNDPCDSNQVYHGPSPFSEAETQNVRFLIDSYPRTRWLVDVHSYGQDILYNWGDDDNQTTDPARNFRNAAFDGTRGVAADAAYAEFIPDGDLAVVQALAGRFSTAVTAVRGKAYVAKSSFDLYPVSGAVDDYAYSRHLTDPAKGKIYGFTVEWGTEFQPPWAEMALIVEDVTAGLIELCLAAPCSGGLIAVTLDTPALVFHDVPAGVETSRAVVFTVETCGAVDFAVIAGPSVTSGPGSFGVPLGAAPLPPQPTSAAREARVWISFQGTAAGDTTQGSVTIRCIQTGHDYVVPISANTIAQPSVAAVLVLDKSGSMADPSGIPGKSRLDVLHESAPNFVTLLPNNDGIGVVSFDQDPHPVMPVTTAGSLGTGAGRLGALSAISAHMTNPAGLTAIGDGVDAAHTLLQSLGGYDRKAIVVFTDGQETAPQYIADVAGLINDRVFAIGLGTVSEVNPVALSQLVANTGGYLLMTDQLGINDIFRLSKYFVQILAGVTNAEIVVDPDGTLGPGTEVKVPFDLAETDYGADAILLSPAPWAIDFAIETPAGIRFDQTGLGGVTGAAFAHGNTMSFYRLSLPLLAGGADAQRGRWHVVLNVRAGNWREYLSTLHRQSAVGGPIAGVPYSVVAHARSSLAMRVFLTQTSREPGTTLLLRAVLTEIGLPVAGRARVVAEVGRPDGSQATLALAEVAPGVFEGATPAPLPGIYPVRFRADGRTLRGSPFTREALRTGIAWHGGDRPPPTQSGSGVKQPDLCHLLECLIEERGIQRWLKTHDIDPAHLARCIEGACKTGR